MKKLIEDNDITACMNFHAYGDLWIYPFNYYKGNDKDVLDPLVFDFY